MSESEPVQERFLQPEGTLRVGQKLHCKRTSKTEWYFTDQFGWKHNALPDGTRVRINPAPSHMANLLTGGKQNSIEGTIINKDGISLIRKSSSVIGGKEYHDDLKLWDGDTIEILSL